MTQQKQAADQHEGAVEEDRPADQPQKGHPNPPGLDDQGMPADEIRIAQDALGARIDETQG